MTQSDKIAAINQLKDNKAFDQWAHCALMERDTEALSLAVWNLAARVLNWRRKHRVIFNRPSIPTGAPQQREMMLEGVGEGLAKLKEWQGGEFYWMHWNAISRGMDNWLRAGGLIPDRAASRGGYISDQRIFVEDIPEWFDKLRARLYNEKRELTAEETSTAGRLRDAYLGHQSAAADVSSETEDAAPLANAPGVSSLLEVKVPDGADGAYNSSASDDEHAERARVTDQDRPVYVDPEKVAAREWNPRPFVQHLADQKLREYDLQLWALLDAIQKAEGIDWYIAKDVHRKRRADDIRRRAAEGWRWIREWCNEFLAAHDIADIFSLKCAMDRNAPGHVTVMDRRGRYDGVLQSTVYPTPPPLVRIAPRRIERLAFGMSLMDYGRTLRVPRSYVDPEASRWTYTAVDRRGILVHVGREIAEKKRRASYALLQIVKSGPYSVPEFEEVPFGESLLDWEA